MNDLSSLFDSSELGIADISTSNSDAPSAMLSPLEIRSCRRKNKKPTGRKASATTKTLSAIKTKNGRPLKKEYVRCQHIRAEKKCIRQILMSLMPTSGLHKFELQEEEKAEVWRNLQILVQNNEELFQTLSSTDESPATDGKGTRTTPPKFRSFSDEYCKNFYDRAEMREFHYFYIKLMYGCSSTDPKAMCVKLAVKCCGDNKRHTSKCKEVWESVRNYMTFTMLEQLNLQPFFERQTENFEDVDELFAEPLIDSFEDISL